MESLLWKYESKTIQKNKSDIYSPITINSSADSVSVEATFFNTEGNKLGVVTEVIALAGVGQPNYNAGTSKLAQTGITECGTTNDTISLGLGDCSIAVDNATGSQIPKGQDGHYQAGLPMSYTLIHNGNDTCIRDNITGLIWEKKTTDAGLRDKNHQYTWYNPDSDLNGGNMGKQNGGYCKGSACDTYAFVQAVNESNYCGYSDWRLPTFEELSSIVDYSGYNPAINNSYFPNTKTNDYYWSSSPNANYNDVAYTVRFHYGNGDYNYKNDTHYVRLVRTGK